jgi:hypothetical protein
LEDIKGAARHSTVGKYYSPNKKSAIKPVKLPGVIAFEVPVYLLLYAGGEKQAKQIFF